jgi:hypothetical protein
MCSAAHRRKKIDFWRCQAYGVAVLNRLNSRDCILATLLQIKPEGLLRSQFSQDHFSSNRRAKTLLKIRSVAKKEA